MESVVRNLKTLALNMDNLLLTDPRVDSFTAFSSIGILADRHPSPRVGFIIEIR